MPAAAVPTSADQVGASVPDLPPNGIRGIGATDAEWEAAHIADSQYQAGSAYDPTPGLGPDPDHTDRYFAVVHLAGIVFAFTERLPHGTSINAAKRAALAELPKDGRIVWFASLDTCAEMELESKTLGRALADPAIGNPKGRLFVEFATETPAGDSGYSAKNANELFLNLIDVPTVDDAPLCG